VIRDDGWVKEGREGISKLTAEAFKGSSIETEYKKLSPTPNDFPAFVKHVFAMASKPYDLGADKLKATKAPVFFPTCPVYMLSATGGQPFGLWPYTCW
jgi:hypothetical protein